MRNHSANDHQTEPATAVLQAVHVPARPTPASRIWPQTRGTAMFARVPASQSPPEDGFCAQVEGQVRGATPLTPRSAVQMSDVS